MVCLLIRVAAVTYVGTRRWSVVGASRTVASWLLLALVTGDIAEVEYQWWSLTSDSMPSALNLNSEMYGTDRQTDRV
jgi:hypothetical protein